LDYTRVRVPVVHAADEVDRDGVSVEAAGLPAIGPAEKFVREYRSEPMGVHGLHKWWYACLARAGVVATGTTSAERMHKARHTAGQRVLDHTRGNLKAVQKLLGHSSISTTGDIYTDRDIDQLAETLREMLEEGESFPPSLLIRDLRRDALRRDGLTRRHESPASAAPSLSDVGGSI
jgi:integrase